LQTARPGNFALALKDLKDGVSSIHIWPMLGWQEIRQRYRRSVMGPFWLTISMGVMIGGMGPLYGKLFGQDLSVYFPHLAISLVVWMLVSNLINDCSNAFIAAEGFIKQIKLPLTIHILRAIWKNLIIFAHNLAVVVLVFLIYPPEMSWHLLQMPLGIFMLAVNSLWFGILVGLFCARFRDIPQIVASMVQIAFFLTPIFWKAEMLGKFMWAAQINPLYHFIEIVRAPLVSGGASLLSWGVVLLITVLGYTVMMLFFTRFRARIAYWV
jgi:ABC-type polysaccharide/polyol phosphate export permease